MVANLTTRLGQLTSSPAGGPYTGENKIINGDMRIDQRNAGAAVVVTTDNQYIIDRWAYRASQASKITAGQSYGGVTPPAGFNYYIGAKVTTAYTIGVSDYFSLNQRIEGYNINDLNFGTANAKAITVSFWVYSSATGTFGGSIQNNAADRSYPFTYTISVASTWEQKSVTIPGDTTGTWLSTNGLGLTLVLSMGTGSTLSGTASAWAASNYKSATGATNIIGTLNATFYVTGAKLEVGSIATPFVMDDYEVSLAKCQRYYNRWTSANGVSDVVAVMQAFGPTRWFGLFASFPPMRAAPTFSVSATGDFSVYNATAASSYPMTSLGGVVTTPTTVSLQGPAATTAVLVSGNATSMVATAAAVWYDLSAEL